VASTEPEETVTLVPIGATKLRVTSFPWIGEPIPSPTAFKCNFDDGTMRDWVIYGGNCSVRDGRLTLGPDNGFMTTVVPGLALNDVAVEADITIGDKGDGGLILRAQKIATGPDAYLGYYVGINAGTKQLLVGKADGRGYQSLGTKAISVAPGQPVHLRVVAKGSRFAVFLGSASQPVHEFSDSTYTIGTIGIRQYGAGQFAADNVSAQPATMVRWR
jgi:hypothetical protein